ncbi:acyltransferase family protein [Erythrobacter sp. BLCC-B19]|uniref:acyltransferase family protein n=1 Tax=Erythrobacter sp. BLCC-B19 TaxID=3025315 RepID=UPI00235E2BAD|nr:acyltransferase [Erythrobacter sp. BLCC-B19]WDA41605.1 acyltransferase [Erythrobacter sp. BLCC-B19]
MTAAAPPAGATMRFEVLDALRGICALLVVLFHFNSNGYLAQLPIVQNGWLFVDYFFVLSGFVIAHSYGTRLTEGRISVARFMGLRMGRIYPLHLFVLLGFVSLEMLLVLGGDTIGRYVSREPFTGSRGIEALIQNLFLFQTFGIGKAVGWNVPAWSIAAEMWTYLVFALVFVVSKGRSALASGVLAVVALLALMSYSPDLDVTFQGGILRCIFGFGLGVVTYHLFRRFGGSGGSAAEIAAVLVSIIFVSFAEGALTFLAPVVFGSVVFVLASQNGGVSQVLKRRSFQFLGLTSYSIYMIHTFIQGRVGEVLQITKIVAIRVDGAGRTFLEGSPLVADAITLAMLALVVGAAYVTYSLVEKPGQALSRRLLAAEPKPASGAGAQ